MTELIEVVQKQDPGSELVTLFELAFNDLTLYFHPGLNDNEDLDNLYFEDVEDPWKIRKYVPFPIEMTGVEYNADGATNRPSVTIANVTTQFSTLVGATNEDLIGQIITVRQTLKSYLEDEDAYNNGGAGLGNGTAPIEFPKKKFIIDRVAGETNLAVTFELSSPYDLQGIKLPNRQVIGKYCSWIYKGQVEGKGGGCTWKGEKEYPTGSGDTMATHKAYFTDENDPLVTPAQLTAMNNSHPGAKSYTTWTTATSYNTGSGTQYVEHSNTVWKLLLTHTSALDKAPKANSKYWIRAEVCGKQLSSCKCRFQFTPYSYATPNSHPTTAKNTSEALPFGAFPGSQKFR
jgi:lambda family phage minor tail protein L